MLLFLLQRSEREEDKSLLTKTFLWYIISQRSLPISFICLEFEIYKTFEMKSLPGSCCIVRMLNMKFLCMILDSFAWIAIYKPHGPVIMFWQPLAHQSLLKRSQRHSYFSDMACKRLYVTCHVRTGYYRKSIIVHLRIAMYQSFIYFAHYE